MVSRIILILAFIGIFAIHYTVWFSGYDIDVFSFILSGIGLGVQTFAAIWVYKDTIGWNKFEYSEGLRLKRKKEDK